MILKSLILAILALPLSKEDPPSPEKTQELEAIATAVHREAGGNLEVMALTISTGFYESSFALRIGRSECKPKECDPVRKGGKTVSHRARGYFQMHKNGLSDAEWEALRGPGSTDAQVREAVRRVRSAFATCKGEPDIVQAAIAQYGGAGCKGFAKVKRGRERVEAYYRIRGRIP